MKIRLYRKLVKKYGQGREDARGVMRYISFRSRRRWFRHMGQQRSPKNAVLDACTLDTANQNGTWDDPIMQMSGCSGEFANDMRKRDMHKGCPRCRG